MKVTAVNDVLKDDSGLINKDAEGDGWVVKVEIKDPKQLDSLMDEAAYKKHCDETKH